MAFIDEEFLFEIKLLKWEFKEEKTNLTKEIGYLNEEKRQLEIDVYLREGEVKRADKEKNHLKKDLESLRKDYVAISKANKS